MKDCIDKIFQFHHPLPSFVFGDDIVFPPPLVFGDDIVVHSARWLITFPREQCHCCTSPSPQRTVPLLHFSFEEMAT